MNKLGPDAIRDLLATLPAWTCDAKRGAISREFTFATFGEAFAFMTLIAIHADKHDHHPEWSNVYNRVHVTLTTHDAGGLTQRDAELARYADAAYANFSSH